MEHGRYSLHQGWENNSALEGYAAVHEPKHRVSVSYDDERRFHDERYPRDAYASRNAFHRDVADRESYPPTPAADLWPNSRKRGYEDEYSLGRESRRYGRQYMDVFHENDTFHNHDNDSYQEADKLRDGYYSIDNYRNHGFDRSARFGGRHNDDYQYDDYDYYTRTYHQTREDSYERDYEYSRYSYDSDRDRSDGREDRWRRREFRDRERDKRGGSRERDESPRRRHERSWSRGHGDYPRSRSPRGRSHGRSEREESYEDSRYDKFDRRRDREEKRPRGSFTVAPSATVVVKGLSQNTTEEDLYQILAEWGPLRHVRVIKERNSGISRGFAFIDFPSVDAARAMIDKMGDDGLVVDGRKLLFEYSSKPTWGTGGSFVQDGAGKSGHMSHRSMTMPSDWMCIICGCVNFARRTSCFQCNEARSDDAPAADFALSSQTALGKKGLEAGPTHVLVVRGLDENADEEMIRYEFSKHAPIKDLRLVKDKFTHVSRGFAFVHFHSVEDATKALEATNGTTLEKNGQVLRVAYAKSVLGPGSGALGSSQSSSLAAAAIEAAAFAQQYDSVGWAPKEYNPDEKQSTSRQEQPGSEAAAGKEHSAPQSTFVWDEASGYYFDAASGFYYDGNTGLYYDGNNGVWYSYDYQSQQYVPCTDKNDNKVSESSKPSDGSNNRKVVISAPAATIVSSEKPASVHDAVQAAAAAALAAEKKEKEKAKEIKFSSKGSILANKKKMNNVLSMWKQKSHEGQATRVALDDSQPSGSADDRIFSTGQSAKSKLRSDAVSAKESLISKPVVSSTSMVSQTAGLEFPVMPRPVSNSSGGTLMGVIRGSRLGGVKSDVSQFGSSSVVHTTVSASSAGPSITDMSGVSTPFQTDASALGAYATPVTSGSGKRRFSEMPLPSAGAHKQQTQTHYRDRAAERRNLYGSSSSSKLHDVGFGESIQDLELTVRKSSLDSMPFPPGVGGVRGVGDADVSAQNYEVITADKAIDESNVGNRMLRNMGWHEGLGLGKDGSGMIAPVRVQGTESRAGLGSRQHQKADPGLEVQVGNSYKTAIHKKALARFREMSEAS